MFKTAIVEPAVKVPYATLIPLVELELSLDTPAQGWAAHLLDRNIEIVEDDLGREAISRVDARQLFAEQRELAQRRAEMLARADEAAIEFDREWRAQLGVGIPASAIPVGMSATVTSLPSCRSGLFALRRSATGRISRPCP